MSPFLSLYTFRWEKIKKKIKDSSFHLHFPFFLFESFSSSFPSLSLWSRTKKKNQNLYEDDDWQSMLGCLMYMDGHVTYTSKWHWTLYVFFWIWSTWSFYLINQNILIINIIKFYIKNIFFEFNFKNYLSNYLNSTVVELNRAWIGVATCLVVHRYMDGRSLVTASRRLYIHHERSCARPLK